jgi:predicted PurR-regulated permease PerM
VEATETVPGRLKTAFAFALAVIVIVLLYWLRSVLLLVFLALLLGILMDSIASLGTRFLKLPRSAAVVLAALVFLVGCAAALTLILVPLVRQGTDFVQKLPQKLAASDRKIEQYRREFPWLNRFLPSSEPAPANAGSSAPQLAKKALITASAALEWGATALATFFLGLFLAWDPERWLRGVAQLLPGPPERDYLMLMRKTGKGLRSYLFALGLYIVVMGVAWAVGLWLIGIDYPLLFGAIGGLVEIVPYIGPMLGLIPPLLLALTAGGAKIIYVLLLYAVLHVVEGYILVPVIMNRSEHLPPPIVILSIMICGEIFGTLGVVLAVPLGTAVYILVNEMVYKRSVPSSPR